MIPYGGDVFYDDLESARTQIELIEILKENAVEGINIRFATASEYFKEVLSENQSFSIFEGDLLPYVTSYSIYGDLFSDMIPESRGRKFFSWTGFYSSRPSLKSKIYEAHSLARAAEITSALIFKKEFEAYNASSALHHDSITGTCRSEVFADYIQRLNYDIRASVDVIRSAYSNIITSSLRPLSINKPYRAFVIYNPINWNLEKLLWIESKSVHVAIYDSKGSILPSQSVPTLNKYYIYFKITLKSLSFTTIFLSEFNSTCTVCSTPSTISNQDSVSNGVYTLHFQDGLLRNITTNHSSLELNERIVAYDSSQGGAYVFNPFVKYI